MFENHDSIETDVHRPEQCPVTDRELAEASPTPLIRRWAERRLVGAPDIEVLPIDLVPRAWPQREPGEPVAVYLDRVPAPGERALSINCLEGLMLLNWTTQSGLRANLDANPRGTLYCVGLPIAPPYVGF